LLKLLYRKTNESTHQLCRSLLQKAIRRGYEEVAQKTANHLFEVGDQAWLRSRVVVICAEECWPFLNTFYYSTKKDEILSAISTLSMLEKNKNAAGLGSLGYALSIGDETVLEEKDNNREIQIIANAIHRPDDFWKWLISQSQSQEQEQVIRKLILLQKKAGWPWDKSFIQSAGFLFIKEPMKSHKIVVKQDLIEFPYWIALDKHTKEGKSAILAVAKECKLPTQQLGWISFYLESALTNKSQCAYWWEREKKWRLNKIGVSINQANDIWLNVKPLLIDRLKFDADQLKSHIVKKEIFVQKALF